MDLAAPPKTYPGLLGDMISGLELGFRLWVGFRANPIGTECKKCPGDAATSPLAPAREPGKYSKLCAGLQGGELVATTIPSYKQRERERGFRVQGLG